MKKRWLSRYIMFLIATANIRPLNFTLLGRISHVTIPSFLIHFGYKNTVFWGYICLVLYVYVKALYGLK